MADPVSPTSELEVLKAELSAIQARFERAAKAAEQKLLKTQFGSRVEHLAERIEAIAKAAADTPPAS